MREIVETEFRDISELVDVKLRLDQDVEPTGLQGRSGRAYSLHSRGQK